MLVHARNPHGVMHIGQYRIYGLATGRGPVDIPFEVYRHYKEYLEDATYREGTLKKLFGRDCPLVAFKVEELQELPDATLDKIGACVSETFDSNASRRSKIKTIRWALRHVSPTR